MQKVLSLYKKEGETPLETIEKFRKENLEYRNEKMTYAGRLDPMAEGVLLVLVGDECKNKEKYLKLGKEYEFEVLWGFQTDTYDILGLPSKSWECHPQLEESSSKNERDLENILEKMKGKQVFEYPPYSSATVKGKQLWQWAREGKLDEIEIPKIETEILNIELLENREITKKNLENNIIKRIHNVKPNSSKKNGQGGDFRQEEIIQKWKEVLGKTRQEKFTISKIKINCSSGTYVRSIANKLGGLTFNIKRLKVGEYSLSNSV